jgi:aspartate kinase
MKVFKFGGASTNSIERIQSVAAIIKDYAKEPLVIIISAMGKTTNALEKVTEAFYDNRKEDALQLFQVIKQQHLTTSKYLLVTHYNDCIKQLNDYFTEVEWLLHDNPVRSFDYYYDQVVCVGELLSTCIISHYLNEMDIKNKLLDVRDILRTDDNFRDAGVDWAITTDRVDEEILKELPKNNVFVTQGFIGATDANESTTLGREGSDYSAAIFANILNADNITIWKDVEGVMNADPKQFQDATLIKELSFDEVIEMAFYGAQVIHPKTIKPLQNKGIPLHVKCFLDSSLPGTTIYKKNIVHLPPIIVVKQRQVLMSLHSKDFSFVGEKLMSRLYELFSKLNLKPNLIQSGAVSIAVCIDDNDKVALLAQAADNLFDVMLQKDLNLLTIRHYTNDLLNKMTREKQVVLLQQTPKTVQVLYQS